MSRAHPRPGPTGHDPRGAAAVALTDRLGRRPIRTAGQHRAQQVRGPRLRLLSLGAGVQSSVVPLLACHEAIPRFDAAVFADTGWEPQPVYEHLARLRAYAERHGIHVLPVSAGNIRADVLDPEHRFVSLPLHVLNPDGTKGLARRQCTSEYKIKPLKAAARRLLGYPHPQRVPPGVYAQQTIGISTDEFHRAKDSDVAYLRNVFPLIELNWTRTDRQNYLTDNGFANTPKSACTGCPCHSNAAWRHLRDTDPTAWEQAIAFDTAIRHGHPRATHARHPPRGQYYLHRSRQPLDQVELDLPAARHRPSAAEHRPEPESEPPGCSPWSGRGDDQPTSRRAA